VIIGHACFGCLGVALLLALHVTSFESLSVKELDTLVLADAVLNAQCSQLIAIYFFLSNSLVAKSYNHTHNSSWRGADGIDARA